MTAATVTMLLFGLLIGLLVLNVPLVAAIGAPTALVMTLYDMNTATFAQRAYAAVDSFTMMAIPFFMLAGKLMEVGGMSRRIVRFAESIIGWIAGGLAYVVVLASTFFGALSGSAAATCAAIGSIMIPEMKKRGYSADFVGALQAAAGGLGVIIPPSITMIMYGVTSATSIGDLFIAGIVPGLIMALCLMTVIYLKIRKSPHAAMRHREPFDGRKFLRTFVDAFFAILVPAIILGGIYSGVFTASEAGAVACIYGFLIGVFWYREISLDNFLEIMGGTITNTVLVMLIVAVSGAFSWLLTFSGAAKFLGLFVNGIAASQFTFLLVSNVIFLVMGMFIESVAAILIITPILHPIAMSLGIDPVHFGIIMVVNLAIGLVTPPVGENQYIAAAIAGIPFEQILKAIVPFFASLILALMIITYVPDLSLFLIRLLR
ncbi:MAG: TRAP transporter large permease [Candidatus Accumulibacter sp.]|jgi:C4-dicarboxylate transporter DctM subunit|nr:TRAP transporter large permease [Accumulibacter sp.]